MMRVKLSFPAKVEVEVGKSADVKVQVSEVGPEPSYPDGTFLRHEDNEIDERVFYIEDQTRRHVTGNAWKPMSEDLGVTWADINALPEPKWKEFLATMEEGKSIEKWPEEEEENHNTAIVYRIAHTTPSKSYCLHDLWELGFNVMHTNDGMKFKIPDFQNWLNKCREKNMMLLPRVVFNDELKDILLAIKDDPALAGIACWDEVDCVDRVGKEAQRKFAEFCERYAPDVLRFGTIDQDWWNKWVDFDSWDVIMASCFPNLEEWENKEAMNRQLQRIREWCPPTKPLMITLRGVDAGQGVANIVDQYRWWNTHIPGGMNSYAIYLHGAGNPHAGFTQRDDMKEQVKKLNEEVK